MPIWDQSDKFFGETLRGFTLPAIRQAHVTQVLDAAKWLASNRAACGGKKVREGDRIVARIVQGHVQHALPRESFVVRGRTVEDSNV